MPTVETQSSHQSKASKSGRRFEDEIYQLLVDQITDPEVSILRPRTQVYKPNTKKSGRRYACLTLHTTIGSIIGDTDIVIFNKKKKEPLVIISCKTSLHGRITESLYYARLYRERYPQLPQFFVTSDNHIEFGSEAKPRKSRVLATYENIFVYSWNPKTILGGCIKSKDSFIEDIKRVIDE
jgi:hypothetical protein